ncbi:ABC transporter ATP-binding protein [Cloacibacillus porcorum]|uniref:ABC transporter ATP-binding protein n=1 Tax=Cloacibacillus porcorum TaxID=1197717 RepID=UPI0023F4C666|nr:ABC transporter ATP-binding protein [Cloacibacillus porcorum]MDD7650532.1 ABC transporter ATP-binding protein [Cloacibacillus porcorum]MDY4093409.1 ABC transporter ATP-binding protein [Cloacibacillus porcorum]
MENIVEIKNLTIEFNSHSAKSHRALDGLDLTLKRGGTLSIVGESGSGKSTLLRAVMVLIPPTTGGVALFGRDTAKITTAELNSLRRRCGYVPQDPYGAIPPGLSVIDAVMEPEIIAGVKRTKEERLERAKKLLAEVGLSGERILASRAVGLSGGQRQRVELARALMLDPELLLCDEPTSMQDASTRGEIIEVLRRRTGGGMSMLFVTHDLLLAAHAAQKIVVLKEGRLCESGDSKEVLAAPRHPYTKALLDALPRIT